MYYEKLKVHLGVTLHSLRLFGVYSRNELLNRVEESGNEYHTVAIGYLCTEYDGELSPNNLGIEARFFKLNQLPEEINPFIKNKLVQLKGQLSPS